MLVCLIIFAAIAAYDDCKTGFGQVSEGSATEWLAGKQLERKQNQPVSVSWMKSPIRDQLFQFSHDRKRSIFLDRRVDPTIALQMRLINQTTEQVVWKVASENSLGVAKIGDVLYVGPKPTAARLPWAIATAEKRLSDLTKAERKKWSTRAAVKWANATTTEEITHWLRSKEVAIDGMLPFDVWPAMDLPRLTLLEQVFLIAAGFETEPLVSEDGKSIALVRPQPLGQQTFKFRIDQHPGLNLQAAAESIPQLKVRKTRRTVTVTGDAIAIMEFQRMVIGAKTPDAPAEASTLLSLNGTATRRDILRKVATETNLELLFEVDAEQLLQDRITIDVQGATLEELMRACLDGTDLGYLVEGQSIKIFQK